MLDRDFYLQHDVVYAARQLLGKVLVSNTDDQYTAGMIVETEAYSGYLDKACHAWKGKTNRNRIMFENGGVAYVYLCYGIHHLFNVVTNTSEFADAVLIRALEPLEGVNTMLARREKNQPDRSLTSGPGSLSKALGIRMEHYGTKLYTSHKLWIEDRGLMINPQDIIATPRIGVGYAGDDALLPWRFFVENNPYVSKGKFIQIAD